MNNTRYFLRKKHMSDIERELTERLNLSLCFKSKRESIYKNSELMVTCKKKYVSVLVFNDRNKSKLSYIENLLW